MANSICAIVGVGPGNGAAFARKFVAEGYRVALLARNEAALRSIAEGLEGARTYACDVTDARGTSEVFRRIREEMGPVEVLVYNAGSGQFGNIDQTTLENLEGAWRVNALGCFACVREVLPDMRKTGRGDIVIIGATASLRGGANFAAFASAKAAQRSLAQSMARLLGPERIHVSYVIIDGVVDLPRTRQLLPDGPAEVFLQPDDIATSVYHLTRQPPSAWTFELDLRPFGEKW